MKKLIAVLLVVMMALSLAACGSTPEVKMIQSKMSDDQTVVAKFSNDGNTTVTYVKGTFNLFGGSANSQNSIATASFEWTGTCEKGKTFTVSAKVNNTANSSGLASKVNRIGVSISKIE